MPHTSYTFPIFEGTFSPVIVRQVEAGAVRFDADGTRVRATLEGGGTALVYGRQAGRWHKIEEIELYNAD